MAGACLLALVLCIRGTRVLIKTKEIHRSAKAMMTNYDTSPSSTITVKMHLMFDLGVHCAVGQFVDGLVMERQRTRYGRRRMIILLSPTKSIHSWLLILRILDIFTMYFNTALEYILHAGQIFWDECNHCVRSIDPGLFRSSISRNFGRERMLEGCELSKTRTPIDTGCEKRWYLMDSDQALPPTAGQNKSAKWLTGSPRKFKT